MKDSLSIPISPDAITGTKRRAKLENFIILPDLNMLNQVRVQYLEPDGQTLKLDAIATDDNLSTYQKQVASAQYADQVVNRQTTGSFVLPTTGELVPGGTSGAISQRDYFQAITLGNLKAQGLVITDQTTLAELIYAMLSGEIQKSDARKEI